MLTQTLALTSALCTLGHTGAVAHEPVDGQTIPVLSVPATADADAFRVEVWTNGYVLHAGGHSTLCACVCDVLGDVRCLVGGTAAERVARLRAELDEAERVDERLCCPIPSNTVLRLRYAVRLAEESASGYDPRAAWDAAVAARRAA